ncbi:MAG: hypothetical protein GXP06_03415 [Alphaproteobacteria bacterium]|nr:hypothetical protein [Alphaproteobacteria bacterium]
MPRLYPRIFSMIGSLTLALAVAGCGAAPEEKTMRNACLAGLFGGAMSKDYCGCVAENMTQNLDKKDLKKYASLMDKALKAQSGKDADVQRLYAEAMSNGFGDMNMTMRIAKATQTATLTCMKQR